MVGVNQLLHAIFSDCQSLRPRRDSRRYRKDLHGVGRQHDGDCALWLGSISCFVKSFQTAKLSGLVGQSPLPESQTARVSGLGGTVASIGTLWPKSVTYVLNLHRRYRFDWMILFRFDDLSL